LLGIACTRLAQYKEAEESLTQANIYDPLNADVWGYLALMCLYDNGRVVQATQALQEMMKCSIESPELVEEIADELVRVGKSEMAEDCFKQILTLLENPKMSDCLVGKGTIHLKLARIYHSDGRTEEAVHEYEAALESIEGEHEKAKIQTILESLHQ
jgi:tetratricopeptide (TPR) repeat protein